MGGIFGDLGNIVNQITRPIGVKLFKGGPYDGRDKVYEAGDVYNTLRGIGTKMLGLETPEGDGGTQNLGDLLSGITSKLNETTTSGGGYNMRPAQRQVLNQRIGDLGQKRQQSIAQAKQKLLARGITGPAYEAALQRINEAYDDMQMRQSAEYEEAARSQQLNELGTLLQQLLGMHQYGTGLLSGAAAGQMGVGQAEAQAAQQAMGNLMGALGTLYGYGALDQLLPKQGRVQTWLDLMKQKSAKPAWLPYGMQQESPYTISVPPITLGGWPYGGGYR